MPLILLSTPLRIVVFIEESAAWRRSRTYPRYSFIPFSYGLRPSFLFFFWRAAELWTPYFRVEIESPSLEVTSSENIAPLSPQGFSSPALL